MNLLFDSKVAFRRTGKNAAFLAVESKEPYSARRRAPFCQGSRLDKGQRQAAHLGPVWAWWGVIVDHRVLLLEAVCWADWRDARIWCSKCVAAIKKKHQRHHEKKARLVIVAAVNPCLEVFSGVEKDRDFFAFLPLPVLYVEWFLHAWEILVGKTKCCRHWVQWIKKPIKKNSVSNPLQRTLMYRLYFLYLWYKMKFFSQYNYLSIFWDMKQRKLRHDTQFGGQKYEKNKHAQQFWRKKTFQLARKSISRRRDYTWQFDVRLQTVLRLGKAPRMLKKKKFHPKY